MHGHPPRTHDRWVPPGEQLAADPLDLAVLTHRPDRSRRRWSFTAISSGDQHRHDDPTDATGSDSGAADERTEADDPDHQLAAEADAGQLATLPAGATFGTLVHSVLELVDFTSDTLADDLRSEVERQLTYRPVDLTPRSADGTRGTPQEGLDLLVAGLVDSIETPLGPLLGDRSLRDLPRADRLDEMDFDLRLGDAQQPASDAELGALIEAHLAPADLFDRQPLHDWASGLVGGRFGAELAGHLTGSIDAVLRVPDERGDPRFVVVDYKTNRLTPRGVPASGADYRPAQLVRAMADHHYPLQALLYSVALHRYLRWRLPDYDPARHLGGVAYLFVRGMVGARTPVSDGERHGVFSWRVSPALVLGPQRPAGRPSPRPRAGERSVGAGSGTVTGAADPNATSVDPADPLDIERHFGSVPAAVGELTPYVEAGVFGPAEVHLAETLVRLAARDDRRAGRPPEPVDPLVLLAVAVAARAPRSGHVCVELDDVHRVVVDRRVEQAEPTWCSGRTR